MGLRKPEPEPEPELTAEGSGFWGAFKKAFNRPPKPTPEDAAKWYEQAGSGYQDEFMCAWFSHPLPLLCTDLC